MEVEGRAEDLAKKIVDLEAQCDRWKEDNVKLKEEMMKVKGKEERVKEKYMKEKVKCEEIREKFDSEKMKWREENEKIKENYWEVEVKKRELTIDLEAALNRQRGGVERAIKAEVEHLESSLKERDIKITNLLGKIEALDRHNNILERDFKDKMAMEAKKMKIEEEKNSKLIQEIQALERDKEQMMAVVSKLQKEKSEEADKSFAVKKALEAEKKRSVEIERKNFELAKKIVEFERTKKSMRDEISKLHMAKSEEVKKSMLREKLAADVERKAYEDDLAKMVAVLVKEKKEMKAQFSRETMEKDADIKRILKEQMALKKEGQKMILERDETNKVLIQENKILEAQNKQLEMEKTRLAQQEHLVSNVVSTLSTPTAQIQGNSKTEDRMPLPTEDDLYSAFLREFDRSKAL